MEMADQNIFLTVHSAGEGANGLWIFKIGYHENTVMVKQFQDFQVISGILDPDVGMVFTSSSGIFIDKGEAQLNATFEFEGLLADVVQIGPDSYHIATISDTNSLGLITYERQ